MPRYLIRLMYDGAGFHGWQKQSGRRSVQGDVEQALLLCSPMKTAVTGSGRTDSGVHALAQFAHFDYSGKMTPRQLLLALNSHLAEDVRITGIWPAADDFHARFQASERSYLYLLAREKTPLNRLYMGFLPRKQIHVERIARLSEILLGSHDFSSLSKDNPDVPNHVCDLSRLAVMDQVGHLSLEFSADRFLHNMVRRIVGTLVNLSHQGLDADVLKRILEERDPRQKLVITAPAQGLYLAGVSYPRLQLDATPVCAEW